MRLKRMYIIPTLVGAFFVMFTGTALASNAQAKGNPTPSCPSPLVFSGKKAACVPCPQGTQYDSSSKTCKATPTPACLSGYMFDKKSAKCVVAATTTPMTTTTTTPGCVTASNSAVLCNQTATSTKAVSDQKVEMLSIDSGNVLQLRLEMNPAPPKNQIGECKTVTGGLNSYFDHAHHVVWISWAGKTARICHTGRGPTGWQKVGPGVKCWNYFQPPKMPAPTPVYTGKYRVVQHFSYSVRMTLRITIHANVAAKAQCQVGDANNGSSASGSATGVDDESIIVTATTSGSTLSQAVSNAQTAALSSQAVNNLQAKVTANATLNMQAKASASCQFSPTPPAATTTVVTTTTTTPTTPTPPPVVVIVVPPPVNHPPTIQWVNVNGHEVPTSENDQFCALVNDPDGNSLSVWFTATLGHTSAAYQPDPFGSPGEWCTSYTAPGSAGTETFSASVSDGIAPTVTITSTFQVVALSGGF